MRPQLRVAIRRVGVRVSCARKDGAALDARLQALLPQRQSLQLVQPVSFSGAVQDRVFEKELSCTVAVDGGLDIVPAAVLLELPRVPAFVVQQARVVVALVEILEDGRKDLGELFGQIDPLGAGFEELASTDGGEEWRVGEDIFVGGEQTLFRTHAYGDDGRRERAGCVHPSAFQADQMEEEDSPADRRAVVRFLGFDVQLLHDGGMFSERPLLLTTCSLARSMLVIASVVMLREALVPIWSSGKHVGSTWWMCPRIRPREMTEL